MKFNSLPATLGRRCGDGVVGENDSDLVLTLQSSVAFGHVGNATAAFALQRLGRDVVRIDTVRFSNHPKHGGFAGGPAPADEIDALVGGLAERGMLRQVGAVLSGYLGTAGNAAAVARAVDAARAARPGALYCLDPVMGDRPGGRYVAADIPDAIRADLLPRADIVMPNAFELELLSGLAVADAEGAVVASRRLIEARGDGLIVATGLEAAGGLETVVVEAASAWRVRTPRIDAPAYGAGDLFCALFLARYLEDRAPARALSLAVSGIQAVFEATARLCRPELALIEAQAAFAAPDHIYAAEAF